MTPEILSVLVILSGAMVLFVTGWLRMDVTALLVLASLALTGLVTSAEALSAFMNNIGGGCHDAPRGHGHRPANPAASLSPPHPPRPGLPDGGLLTLVGTPPNIVVSGALAMQGLEPFHLFDFTPIGLVILGAGIAFVVGVGRHLLPERDPRRESGEPGQYGLVESYDLHERVFTARLPRRSRLDGKTLAESRMGSALGLHVLAIHRSLGRAELAPGPEAVLRGGDRLLVQGRPDILKEIQEGRHLRPEGRDRIDEYLVSDRVGLMEARVPHGSPLVGQTLNQTDLRNRTGAVVLAILKGTRLRRTNLEDAPLDVEDALLLQGPHEHLAALVEGSEFEDVRKRNANEAVRTYQLAERFFTLRITSGSLLAGRSLRDSRLGDAAGLMVLGIRRTEGTLLIPDPDEIFRPGDLLLVKARPDTLLVLRGLQDLEFEVEGDYLLDELESETVGLMEVVLAPRTKLAGSTPRQIGFREKHGLTVLALWRAGRVYRTKLAPVALFVLVGALLPVMLGWASIAIAVRMAAEAMVGVTGELGPRAVLAGLCVMTALGAQVIPSVALVVVMAPVVLATAADLGISPHTLMMGVALSAASLSSPVAHPANILVMGPGGYRYMDYV